MILQFEKFDVDTENFKLTKDGESIPVEPQVFDLIVYLVENRHRLISRQELFDNLWQGRSVSDTSLSNHIKSARKALGDDGHRQEIIKTIHGRGYQFIAPIEATQVANQDRRNPSKNYRRRYQITLSGFVLLVSLMLFQQLWQSTDTFVFEKSLRKIAVLPFSNTKSEIESDYFGFAIADQVIGELNYLKDIAVRSSSSIRKYSKKVIDPIAVGNELDVDYVLSGSYLKEGNIIRLNIELVEVATNELIWRGKQLQVNYQNAFDLQDVVTKAVIEGLKIEFSAVEINRMRKDIASNPLAYEYYFKSITYPLTTQGHQLAVAMLKKSIELDDSYAPAYVQLGNRMRRLAQYGLINTPEQSTVEPYSTEQYYLKALSLNPELLTALSYLAMFYTETNRIDEAIKLANRITKINPNSADGHFTLGYIYRYAGMVKQAINEMEKAVAIDPKNPRYRSLIGAYSGAGEFQKALSMTDLYEESPFTLGWKGLMLRRLGKTEDALNYFNRVIAIDPKGLWGKVATVHKAAVTGDLEQGLAAAAKLDNTDISDGETIYYTANYYALLGARDLSIQRLRQAVENGYFNFEFIAASSHFERIKNDPEFQQILQLAKQKHLAFKQQHFASIVHNQAES